MDDIKVVLIEDFVLLRSALKVALETNSKIIVVGEADCPESALKLIKTLKPDVILMDAHLPNAGSLEIIPKVLRWQSDAKIIIMTEYQNDPLVTRLLKIGAVGCFTKETTITDAIQAIRAVNVGQRYLNSATATAIALNSINGDAKSSLELLSSRETQVMMLVIQGITTATIAEQLNMSPKTVCSYRYRMFEKLSVKNDIELMHFALKYGLLDIGHLKG